MPHELLPKNIQKETGWSSNERRVLEHFLDPQNTSGVMTWLAASKIVPLLTEEGFHTMIGSLERKLHASPYEFTGEFAFDRQRSGRFSKGFGIVDPSHDELWEQNLSNRLANTLEQEVISDQKQKLTWQQLGPFQVILPTYHTGLYPNPTVAVVRESDTPESMKVLPISPFEKRFIQFLIENGQYVDPIFWQTQSRENPIKISGAVDQINKRFAPILNADLLGGTWPTGYAVEKDPQKRNILLTEWVVNTLSVSPLSKIRSHRTSINNVQLRSGPNTTIIMTTTDHETMARIAEMSSVPFAVNDTFDSLLIITPSHYWSTGLRKDSKVVEITRPEREILNRFFTSSRDLDTHYAASGSIIIPLPVGESPEERRERDRVRKSFQLFINRLYRIHSFDIKYGTGKASRSELVFPVPNDW